MTAFCRLQTFLANELIAMPPNPSVNRTALGVASPASAAGYLSR
jgi:hypothetical protein